jgi:hypothetical protein
LEFSKKYDKQLVNVEIPEKTTQQIIKEDAEAKETEAKDAEAKETETKETEAKETEAKEESDDEGLSQVTIDSIKRAEEEFEKYQDLDDFDTDEKSPINIGDEVNKDELEVENLNSQKGEPNETSPKSVKINESKNEDILEIEELPVEDESKDESKDMPLLKLSTTNLDVEDINTDTSLSNSIQKKTIKINQQ